MLTMEYARVMWVAEQCEGLADALRCIHRFVSISKDGTTTRLVPSHHGDIKPENILVFCRPHRPPVLQLADFGKSTYATVFNNKRPVMDVDHSAGDYTAPEVYFGEPVSSNSDVWSLCCVFLDFIEWIMPSQSAPGQPRRVLSDLEEKGIYVQGREAVRDWRRSRVGIGCVDEARYFFDTGTGEPNIWVDTVSGCSPVQMCFDSANVVLYSGCMMLKITPSVQIGCVLSWAFWTNTFCNKRPTTEYQVELCTPCCEISACPVSTL